jgi:uncharacterized membrane protein YhhN
VEETGKLVYFDRAVLFVSSDSLVAFNKFYNPLVLSSFIIMITYLIAQYLIVSGILKLNQKIAFSNLENAIIFFKL